MEISYSKFRACILLVVLNLGGGFLLVRDSFATSLISSDRSLTLYAEGTVRRHFTGSQGYRGNTSQESFARLMDDSELSHISPDGRFRWIINGLYNKFAWFDFSDSPASGLVDSQYLGVKIFTGEEVGRSILARFDAPAHCRIGETDIADDQVVLVEDASGAVVHSGGVTNLIEGRYVIFQLRMFADHDMSGAVYCESSGSLTVLKN